MANCHGIICFLVLSCLVRAYKASAGDSEPLYWSCLDKCEKTGCVEERCFPHCNYSSDDSSLYLWWGRLVCSSDCRYHCILDREKERAQLSQVPVKYHGRWPVHHLYGFQEPLSVIFSVLNLSVHLHGFLSFHSLVYNKLTLATDKKPFYDYVGLWNIYGLLSVNAWFWSTVFHIRDIDLTKKLDYSSAVALCVYSLILTIIRSFDLKHDAAKVMVSAPLIAFATTHILFLLNYKMDYGWKTKVSVAMDLMQLLVWSVWSTFSHHPSRWKLRAVVLGGCFAMLLEIFNFPPYKGLLDGHALWQASSIPLAYIWWSFIKDDAKYTTSVLLKKAR